MDIVFASTRICDEFFHLRLQFLNQFLLLTTHGESELSCNYNEIMRRYCHCIAVRCGDRATSIQGIEGRSLLLLSVLAVKNEGRGRLLEEKVKKKEEGLYLCNDGILRD